VRNPHPSAWRQLVISTLFLLGLCVPVASAQTVELGSYGSVFGRVTLTVFDNTRVIRGLVIGLENDFANTFSGDYYAMCWDQGFALLGVDVITYPNAWDGSGQAILDKLHGAAISLNRPELDNVPFCVTGFSRGGDWSWSFAAMHPDRTIAFVSNKTSFFTNETTPNPDILPSDPVFQLPALLNTGDPGLDAATVTNAVESNPYGTPRFFNHFRPAGARYALTREMGAGHEIKNFNRMTGAFFGAMCRLRYPLSLNPLAGKPALLPLPPANQGWLGDNAAYTINTRLASYAPAGSYTGSNAIATNFTSYLATEDIAALWRASISRTDTVTIDRGYGVQEGTVGNLVVHTDGYPGATRVDVYDGATLVGSAQAPTTVGGTTWQVGVTFHAPYQHVFYALVDGPSGKRTTDISPIYCQLNRPNPPATFTAAGRSSSSIGLAWSAVATAEYYRLTRTLGATTTFVADVPASTATSYTDSGLAAGTTYTYHMQVLRSNQWSWQDCSATATTWSGSGTSSPVISSAGTASGTVGKPFSYAITASNSPTGYSVTGALPGGLALNSATGVISGTPAVAGSWSVTIAASNAGGTGTRALAMTIAPAAAVPVITSPLTASGSVGQAFTYAITATNGPTAYSISGAVPPGLALNTATGVISGTPTSAISTSVLIAAGNANGAGTASLSITIASTPSATPVISSAGTTSGTVGQAFSYTITASNSPTGYSVTGALPGGLALNSSTGVISGTPTAAGSCSVTLAASNAGGTGTKALAMTIASTAAVPVITSPLSASGSVGQAFTYAITATNGPTAYSISGAVPPGLALNTATGVISGTPTSAINTSVLIAAGNANGAGTAHLTIAITGPATAAPVITSPLTASGSVGQAFTYAITATNGPTAYSVSGVVPPGLALNTATGVISGTPTSAISSAVLIAAGNANGTGVANLVITITSTKAAALAAGSVGVATGNSPPVEAAPIPDQVAIVGTPYRFIPAAGTFTDPDGDTLVWSAGGLPAWLSFDPATHAFSGTPGAGDLGHPATITVRAVDPDGAATTTSFTLQVDEPPVEPPKSVASAAGRPCPEGRAPGASAGSGT
jgi:hypothetical protein